MNLKLILPTIATFFIFILLIVASDEHNQTMEDPGFLLLNSDLNDTFFNETTINGTVITDKTSTGSVLLTSISAVFKPIGNKIFELAQAHADEYWSWWTAEDFLIAIWIVLSLIIILVSGLCIHEMSLCSKIPWRPKIKGWKWKPLYKSTRREEIEMGRWV